MNLGSNLLYVAIGCGILALLYGIITSRQVLGMSPGNQRMIEVAAAIQEGAGAYLRRQYTTIAVVGIIVAVIIGIFLKPLSAIAFLIGAIDRKSTRLNSSHVEISYAVFCLKKKIKVRDKLEQDALVAAAKVDRPD